MAGLVPMGADIREQDATNLRVMAGLVPAIHVFYRDAYVLATKISAPKPWELRQICPTVGQDGDGRDEPGHDGGETQTQPRSATARLVLVQAQQAAPRGEKNGGTGDEPRHRPPWQPLSRLVRRRPA